MGAEQESQECDQWARKPRHLFRIGVCRQEVQADFAQPQSGAFASQLTGSAQPQAALVEQDGPQPPPLVPQ
jgi:hypothetical protein